MSREDECRKVISLLKEQGDYAIWIDRILADIALSLAQIADGLKLPIRVEEVNAAPTYYAYCDPNDPIRNRGYGGNGDHQDDEL